MTDTVQGGSSNYKPFDSERARTSAFAQLRQQVWDSSQHLTYNEIREYVEGVLAEIQSDEP